MSNSENNNNSPTKQGPEFNIRSKDKEAKSAIDNKENIPRNTLPVKAGSSKRVSISVITPKCCYGNPNEVSDCGSSSRQIHGKKKRRRSTEDDDSLKHGETGVGEGGEIKEAVCCTELNLDDKQPPKRSCTDTSDPEDDVLILDYSDWDYDDE